MIKLLEKLKGKKLDENRYELLRHAAELRKEKLKLLRKANKILEENNLLLREKIRFLEREIARMSLGPETGPVPVPASPCDAAPSHIQEISDMTVAVLRQCLGRNLATFNAAEMSAGLSADGREVEEALSELVESGLIERQDAGRGAPTYRLTAAGRSYARTLPG